MPTRRSILTTAAVLPLVAVPAPAAQPGVFAPGGVAINGYDPVAYFTDDGPLKGRADHSLDWNGATWHFANAHNRAVFAADPEGFAPQYGGYCAYAVSEGYTAKTDPYAWALHGGKLYLNYSRRVHRIWSRDIPGRIARGDANWPGVLGQ